MIITGQMSKDKMAGDEQKVLEKMADWANRLRANGYVVTYGREGLALVLRARHQTDPAGTTGKEVFTKDVAGQVVTATAEEHVKIDSEQKAGSTARDEPVIEGLRKKRRDARDAESRSGETGDAESRSGEN